MNAHAVVADPNQIDTRAVDFDHDLGGGGVEAVFDQFLDDRRGALDDFSRSDSIGHGGLQNSDAAAALSGRPSPSSGVRDHGHGWLGGTASSTPIAPHTRLRRCPAHSRPCMIRTPAPFEAHDLSRLGCLLLGGPLTKLLAQVM